MTAANLLSAGGAAEMSSPGSATTVLRVQAAPAIASGQTVAAARDAQLDPKLVSAAHEFEASLMQELLKPLNSDSFLGEDDAGAGSDLASLTSPAEGSGNALMSFGSEALAEAISRRGGLGIARRVLDHFEQGMEGPAGKARNGVAGEADENPRPLLK